MMRSRRANSPAPNLGVSEGAQRTDDVQESTTHPERLTPHVGKALARLDAPRLLALHTSDVT